MPADLRDDYWWWWERRGWGLGGGRDGLRIGWRPNCTLVSFGQTTQHPRYHRRPRRPTHWMRTFGSFLIECVCISQQLAGMRKKLLSSCVSPSLRLNLFLPVDFHPGFMHLHLLKFLHFRCFFLNFIAVFAHYSEFCIFPYLIAPICRLSVKMHCHVGQTNRPCLVWFTFRDTVLMIKSLN